jgi:hypothetical protein
MTVLGPLAKRRAVFVMPPEHEDGIADLCTNPSSVIFKGRMVSAIRCVSYVIMENGDYGIAREGFHSRTLILSDSKVVGQVPYDIRNFGSEETPHRGIEDVRLFVHEGNLRGVGTTLTAPGKLGRASQALLNFSDDLRFLSAEPLTYSGEQTHEKNWVPWDSDSGFVYIYSWSPMQVFLSKHLAPIHISPGVEGGWRNNTAPIAWGEDSIALVHRWSGKPRFYEHAFLRMKSDGRITVSRPFSFDAPGVEFAMSMLPLAYEADGVPEQVLISYGFRDAEARWAWHSRETVESLFSPRDSGAGEDLRMVIVGA